MSLDTALVAELKKMLTENVGEAKDRLPGAMAEREYLIACGMIVAWQQIHDNIDAIVEKLQRS